MSIDAQLLALTDDINDPLILGDDLPDTRLAAHKTTTSLQSGDVMGAPLVSSTPLAKHSNDPRDRAKRISTADGHLLSAAATAGLMSEASELARLKSLRKSHSRRSQRN